MKFIIAAFAIFTLIGCSSTRVRTLSKIKTGMSKPSVLDIAGNPSRSSRVEGADRWSYDYWSGDERKTLNVHFVDGAVTQVGPPKESAPEESPGFKRIGK
jgi:outer membrane protein assembly factor BamE (lipoprotein component of BamABCDE complex)